MLFCRGIAPYAALATRTFTGVVVRADVGCEHYLCRYSGSGCSVQFWLTRVPLDCYFYSAASAFRRCNVTSLLSVYTTLLPQVTLLTTATPCAANLDASVR